MNYILISLHRKPKKDFEKNILPKLGEEFYKLHNTCYILITNNSARRTRAFLIFQYPEMEEFVIYPVTKEYKDSLLTTTISTHKNLNNFKNNYIEEIEDTEENLNIILDKIKKQGYQNLSPAEKDFLNKKSEIYD